MKLSKESFIARAVSSLCEGWAITFDSFVAPLGVRKLDTDGSVQQYVSPQDRIERAQFEFDRAEKELREAKKEYRMEYEAAERASQPDPSEDMG